MPENDINRLPKWARLELIRLRRKIVELEAALCAADEAPPSALKMLPTASSDRVVNLPERSIIRFEMERPPDPARQWKRNQIEVYFEYEKERLRICGERPILVRPQAANVVLVSIDEEI